MSIIICPNCGKNIELKHCNGCIKELAARGTVWTSHNTSLTGHAADAYMGPLWDVEEWQRKQAMKSVGSSSKLSEAFKEADELFESIAADLPVSAEASALGMTQAEFDACHKSIPIELYNKLNYLGLIPSDVRSTHVGQSDYSSKLIQPWTIFLGNPELNYMECDLIKRIIRTNTRDTRLNDLTKCKHIIDELIRQLDTKEQQ